MVRSIEKKSSDLIGNGTRDIPDCSMVPQPTVLPLAPGLSVPLFKTHLNRQGFGVRRGGGVRFRIVRKAVLFLLAANCGVI
jgi:hypothetical protein